MRRTGQQIVDLIAHGLGKTPDARNDLWNVVNDAGRQLVTSRDWPWRTADAVALFSVAGQPWIDLPADFGGDPIVTSTPGFVVTRTNYAEIQRLRSLSQVTGYASGWLVTFEANTVSPSQSGTPTPRMDVFPTPTVSGAWGSLVYKRGWRSLVSTQPDLYPSTPAEYDLALVYLARAIAEAIENQSAAIEDGLAQKEIDRLWQWECSKTTNHGQLRGGAGRFMKAHQSGDWPFGRYGTFST